MAAAAKLPFSSRKGVEDHFKKYPSKHFALLFQGKSIHKQFRMGSRADDMKMEDFIKIEKIGEGN